MESLFNPAALAALITALCTGAGGTWLAFKQFHVNRAKTSFEIEASLRSELREDIEKYRQDTEELRNKVTQLFEENLSLKHTIANVTQQNRALNSRIDRLLSEKKEKKVEHKPTHVEKHENKTSDHKPKKKGNSNAGNKKAKPD